MDDSRTLKIADINQSSVGNVRADLGNLKELTASIKKSGILQPLTVRPEPDGDGFELVFGHRRLAAAKLAKLTEVPILVKTLTDAQVVELQLVENIQREDIHALDEAIAFYRLREDFDVEVEQLAKETGKSKAYIYASLKLVELSAHAQAKYRKGDFDTSVALYIARLNTDESQKEACKLVSEPGWHGEKPSAREAFKIVDELKAKNDLDEQWVKVKAEAEKNAEMVLSPAKAKDIFSHHSVGHNTGYLDLAAVDYDHPKHSTVQQIVAKDMPPVIHAQNPLTRAPHRIVTTKEFNISVKRIYGDKGYKPARSKMSEADRKANEKAALDRKFRALATPFVGEKALNGANVNFLRAMLALFVERCSWGTFNNSLIKPYEGRTEATFKASIATFTEKQLKDELLTLALQGASTTEFANVCKLVKVSPAAVTKIKKDIAEETKANAAKARARAKAKAKAEAKAKAAPPKGKNGKPLSLKKKKPAKKKSAKS